MSFLDTISFVRVVSNACSNKLRTYCVETAEVIWNFSQMFVVKSISQKQRFNIL